MNILVGLAFKENCPDLRYFNVFGKRQDPEGAYAAVIPKWTAAMIKGEDVFINGDGETSRDFCYIDNTVQMNLLAATTTAPEARNQVYNVAVGERTTLNELFFAIQDALDESNPWQFLVSSAATAKYGLSRTAGWQPWKPRHPN